MQTPERAGWHDDPDDPEQLRYFDGIIWSDRRVPKKAPVREPEPVTPSPEPASSPQGGPWGHPPAAGQARPSGTTAGPAAADGRPYAGVGLRLVSGLLDLLVIWTVGGVLSSWAWWLWMRDYLGFAMDNLGNPAAVQALDPEELMALFDWTWFPVAVLVIAAVAWLYQVLMLRSRAATLGKMATATVVRPVGSTGTGPLPGPVAMRRASASTALWLLCVVPVVSYLAVPLLAIAYLWVIRDPHRQALHDKVAGTEVVSR